MKTVVIVFLLLSVATASEGFRNQAVTISAGIPGLLLPELGYEYAFDRSNRLGVALGTLWIIPEARISYIRMIKSAELAASFGIVGEISDEHFGLITSDDPPVYLSATAGYRHETGGGFIFRIAGGAGLFMWDDEDVTIPFGQIGIGYGF